MDKSIQNVLTTWYPEDHPLHLDPLHPAIGLAGEAGELLDLYKKERFKNGVSWWDCVHCEHTRHDNRFCGWFVSINNNSFNCQCNNYTPKILDELGDLWYYLRVIVYQFELPIATPILQTMRPAMDVILSQLNIATAKFLEGIIIEGGLETKFARLDDVNYWFFMALREFDYTLDQLTELNWQKLKDGDNNGWATARKLPESQSDPR